MSTVAAEQALAQSVERIGPALLQIPEDQWFDRKSARISPKDLADKLVGFAIRYFNDRELPEKSFRAPEPNEREALAELAASLAPLDAHTDAEAIQNIVYEVGKAHGFENLRDWFKALYQILLGQDQGPRFGSFVALYGVEETRTLIADALEGRLSV